MSKTLATIRLDAETEFDLNGARHGNPYTKEAHELFQKLQFKNLLGRFDVETSANDVEATFCEVTGKAAIEKIFKEAEKAENGQAGLSLSVFRHAGPGRAGTAQNTFSGCRIRSKSL